MVLINFTKPRIVGKNILASEPCVLEECTKDQQPPHEGRLLRPKYRVLC